MLETQREFVPRNDDEEQLGRRLVESDTTLLGLVRHQSDGERHWFGYTFAGDERWADVDFSMVVPEDRSAADVIADYLTLRWVLAHLTGETTRHAGHTDILRELIDGTTGR